MGLSLTSPDTMIARNTRDGTYLMAEQNLQVQLIGASEIHSPAELKNKRLAGDPGDSNYDLHRRKILRDYGVPESEYDVEIIGTSPFRLDALRKGRVSACMLAPPYDAQALGEGFNLLAKASDHIPKYSTTGCWARSSWVDSNRDKMLRFALGFVHATDWLLLPENREETLELLQEYQNLTLEQAEIKVTQVVARAAIDPAALNRVVQLRIDMGLYAPPYEPIERFYDATVWAEVTGLPVPARFGKPRPL